MRKWLKLQQTTRNIRSIPQGSVLGLVLFIIYITHPTLFDGSMTLFTDDFMIYRPIRSLQKDALIRI